MVYGSDSLVQLANKDRTLVDNDVVGYVYLLKLDRDLMLKAYYINVSALSTSIWRLTAQATLPGLSVTQPKRLYNSLKTEVPRRLIAAKFSDLFPLYANPKARAWWMRNLAPLDSKSSYLKNMLGGISRSCCIPMFIEHDAPLDAANVEFILQLHRLLGYPDDDNFYTRFATPVYLSKVVGTSLKAKASVLLTAPKHLRRRIALMNDATNSLTDCVRVAEATGCRVVVHASNFVEHDGGPLNLKHKLVKRAAKTTQNNAGSSSNLFIVTTESSSKRLSKIVTYYATLGSVVICSRS